MGLGWCCVGGLVIGFAAWSGETMLGLDWVDGLRCVGSLRGREDGAERDMYHHCIWMRRRTHSCQHHMGA